MTTSLIISTYNRPDALEVCLESVKNLSPLPDEVIIGDDGSRPDTAELIRRFQSSFPVPLRLIYQEDKGFRLAMIRNKCVAAATGDYIIQIDGDIFLNRNFIADHLREAEKGHFLKGGRVQLGEELSTQICSNRKPVPISPFTAGIEAKRPNAVRIPLLADWLAPRYRKNRDNVLGCNMSFFRSDFIAINGYDEDFEGWGGEDLDLALRFHNLGVRKKYLKFCALAYHLWHREASKSESEANHRRAYAHSANGVVRAASGVDRYLATTDRLE